MGLCRSWAHYNLTSVFAPWECSYLIHPVYLFAVCLMTLKYRREGSVHFLMESWLCRPHSLTSSDYVWPHHAFTSWIRGGRTVFTWSPACIVLPSGAQWVTQFPRCLVLEVEVLFFLFLFSCHIRPPRTQYALNSVLKSSLLIYEVQLKSFEP